MNRAIAFRWAARPAGADARVALVQDGKLLAASTLIAPW